MVAWIPMHFNSQVTKGSLSMRMYFWKWTCYDTEFILHTEFRTLQTHLHVSRGWFGSLVFIVEIFT